MTATFQVNIVQFLLYFGIVTGFILFSILLVQRRQFRGSLWLALLILILPLNFLNYTIVPSLYRQWELFTLVRIPVLYGFGLLFYLYVNAVIRPSFQWKRVHLWYLLPLVLDVMYSFGQATYIRFWDLSNKGDWFYWQSEFLIHEGLAVVYNMAFVIASYILLLKTCRSAVAGRELSDSKRRWLMLIGRANLLVSTVWLGYYVAECLVYPQIISFQQYYPLWLIDVILILIIGYRSIVQPKVVFRTNGLETIPASKYQHSGLGEEELQALGKRLIAWVEESEAFLDPQLKLADLSEALGVSPHILSQVFSQAIQANFYDFVNQYRVEKVKQYLQDSKKQSATILSLAFDAGFNSKTTFNTAFKKFTGTSPSAYRKKSLTQSSSTD